MSCSKQLPTILSSKFDTITVTKTSQYMCQEYCALDKICLSFLRLGSDHSLNGSNQDLSGDCLAAPFQDSQGLFTETGVCMCVYLKA